MQPTISPLAMASKFLRQGRLVAAGLFLMAHVGVALASAGIPAALTWVTEGETRHWLLLVVVLCWLPLAYARPLQSLGGRVGTWMRVHIRGTGLAMALVFGLLVAGGITGSSMNLLAIGPWNNGGPQGTIEFQGQKNNLFAYRGVRSDEWLVMAPNTLAQWNHHPQFPVVNSNLGTQGQNMGVIGMVGVPVSQPAALAKPATWGYFFLPLRQALSWHWQLPFFACLFFLWQTLALLNPRSPGFNLLLSFTFCVQPYAAAWSLWPLYATAFPLALLVLAGAALRSSRTGLVIASGVAMGVLLAGWALVLYPPWQITVGTLVALVAIGWVADHWHTLSWKKAHGFAFAIALVLAAGLLGSWWLDTRDAVDLIRHTVYPGARTALQGADISVPWWTLRGYLNPEALPFGTGPAINQSEISGYLLFPLPVMALGLWHCFRTSAYRWTMVACMVFLAFCLVFRFAGIPLWLAKVSLWSYVTSTRLDLSVALACTLVVGMVYRGSGQDADQSGLVVPAWLAATVAVLGALLVVWQFEFLPPGILQLNSAPLMLAMALAVGCGSWWMLRGSLRAAAALLLMLALVATLVFNPLSKAPRDVKLSAGAAALAGSADQANPKRVLVISGSATPSMMLAAAGTPTVGGVFYYPHSELWKKMGLPQQEWPVVNRYQHLTFTLGSTAQDRGFSVHSAQLDTVNVELDAPGFDFSKTGAGRVAALEQDAIFLRKNPSLKEIGSYGAWVWFVVCEAGSCSQTVSRQ